MIISDVGNPFFTSMVRGVEDVAQSAGFSVVLCNSDEDIHKESKYIAGAVSDRMAGVLISPSSEAQTDIRALIQTRTPVVVIDRKLRRPLVDMVLVDNASGAAEATSHLIEQGYRRVACITGPKDVPTAHDRARGYRAALRSAGHKVDSTLLRYADFRERGGYDAMASLLNLPLPPDAVFVANNLMTVGAMRCLAARGVPVPAGVGVVGFDDVPWAELVQPSLSTVRQPAYEMGTVAADLLARRIVDPDSPRQTVTLPTELVARNSSLRLPKSADETLTHPVA
jgi:LacI family transcriptional regulator